MRYATVILAICLAGCSNSESDPAKDSMMTRTPTIHDWVENGDVDKVRQLLDESPELISSIYSNDLPDMPLHCAAAQGQIEVVRLLLARGADVNCRGDQGRTPLHYAASVGYVDIVDLLVSERADMSLTTDFGHTPLVSGAYSRETEGVEAAERLLQLGATLDLNSAFALGRTDDVRRMLRDEANAIDSSPLPDQLLNDAVVMINGKLYENDVVDATTKIDDVDAVIERELDIVRRLIQLEPPVDGQTLHTALFTAVQFSHTGVVELLLDYGSKQGALPVTGKLTQLCGIANVSRRAEQMQTLLRMYGADEGPYSFLFDR